MWWHTVTHGRRSEGGNWRMEWVASTLHTISEHGVSSITTADARTSAASSRLNWRPPPCRFKWFRPFRRKTISGFCTCAITFQMQSTCSVKFVCNRAVSEPTWCNEWLEAIMVEVLLSFVFDIMIPFHTLEVVHVICECRTVLKGIVFYNSLNIKHKWVLQNIPEVPIVLSACVSPLDHVSRDSGR
jgi:hypothetical protein